MESEGQILNSKKYPFHLNSIKDETVCENTKVHGFKHESHQQFVDYWWSDTNGPFNIFWQASWAGCCLATWHGGMKTHFYFSEKWPNFDQCCVTLVWQTQWVIQTGTCLHSSFGRASSYVSLMWDTPISGWSQCTWSLDWVLLRRRPKQEVQRTLWMSRIFWMIPCSQRVKDTNWAWTFPW